MYHYLTECNVPSGLPRSCDEVYHNGSTQSGNYTIAPDVNGCTNPFTVECNMATQPPTTILHHNLEQEEVVLGYYFVGNFKRSIHYLMADYDQIRSLVHASNECYYSYIEKCVYSRMTGFTFWISYTGIRILDLPGVTEGICQGIQYIIYQYFDIHKITKSIDHYIVGLMHGYVFWSIGIHLGLEVNPDIKIKKEKI